MIKIVLITPILQHYRLTFYEKLAKAHPEYDLNVFHGVKKSDDGKPGFSGETEFKNFGFTQVSTKPPLQKLNRRFKRHFLKLKLNSTKGALKL